MRHGLHVYGLQRFLICFCAGVFLLTGDGRAGAQKTLTIEGDIWCPINCGDTGPEQGVGVELARKIFEPLGYKVEYKVVPWARAIQDVRQGRANAAVGANSTDDPHLLFPHHPIYEITDDFFVLQDDGWQFKDIASLENRRIGVINDYGYSELVKNFINSHYEFPGVIQEVSGDDALPQNIKKLLAGRINVVIESKPVMEYRLRKLKLQDKIRWAGGMKQGFVYLAFSPNIPESKTLIKLYDEGVNKLKEEKGLEEIYHPYGMTP